MLEFPSMGFIIGDPALPARFRDALRKGGYDEKGLVGALGSIQLPTRAGGDLPHFLYLTRDGSALSTFIRMYVLGVAVEEEAARRALAPLSLEECIQAGVVETRAGGVTGAIRLLPYHGLMLACDHMETLAPGGQREMVMGITASSAAVADFTVRRPVGATLDLGTGGGIQAFLAAPHSRTVLGCDRSERSIEFARFNAALNGIANCEFAAGDLFEPAHGRTFDLIVSNPPFAITPTYRYMYRDSGVELDGFCRRLVKTAPQFLNEGGLLQICCDWAHIAGQDWKDRLAGWFEGTGCDTWVLRTDHHTAAGYAHVWIRDTEHETPEAAAQLYRDWLSFYESKGLEGVSTGLIAMRRASGRPNWLRIEEAPGDITGQFGDAVALGFQMHDYLRETTDAQLLEEKLRVSPFARLEESSEWCEKGWRTTEASIRLARGITYSSNIDLRLAGMLARCAGQRTVQDLLAELAAATDSNLEKITPNLLGLLRQLIERGFLLPLSLRRDG